MKRVNIRTGLVDRGYVLYAIQTSARELMAHLDFDEIQLSIIDVMIRGFERNFLKQKEI